MRPPAGTVVDKMSPAARSRQSVTPPCQVTSQRRASSASESEDPCVVSSYLVAAVALAVGTCQNLDVYWLPALTAMLPLHTVRSSCARRSHPTHSFSVTRSACSPGYMTP